MDANELLNRYAAGERDFRQANLRGIVLSPIDLYRSSDAPTLRLANLNEHQQRPYLIGANLSQADLTKAHLSRANLSKADLSGANLTGANLISAPMRLALGRIAPVRFAQFK